MKVRDKNIKQMVDVSDKNCPKRECYWPRPDPGVFIQGVGYRTRYPERKPEWICGNREIRGCPAKYCHANLEADRIGKSDESVKPRAAIPAPVEQIVRPDYIVLLQNYTFIGPTKGRSFIETLKVGEIGEYYEPSNCFTFRKCRGWVPFIFWSHLREHTDLWAAKV